MKNKQLQLPTLLPEELNPAWFNDISKMYAKGIPMARIAEIYDISEDTLNVAIREALAGNLEYQDLNKALTIATRDYEEQIFTTLNDLALGKATSKTVKNIRDAKGNLIRSEETITTHKPDAEVALQLLAFRSDKYNRKSTNSNDTNIQTNIQINMVDNGRPVIIDED